MAKQGLQLPDYVVLSFIFFCGLLIIGLDFLAHQGVGININLFGSPRTSYAILVEIVMFSSVAIYGIVKRDAKFLFMAGILAFTMFIIGSVLGAG